MTKLYEISPLEIGAAGAPVVLAIPFPSRVTIQKLIVIQVGGTPENFTVELFNHAPAAGGTDFSSPAPPLAGGNAVVPEEIYRVCAPLTSDAPGKLSKIGVSFSFFSHQDQADGPLTVNRRVLYMRITPSTGQAKTFVVMIGSKAEE
jgi:hypothetical protein